MSLSPDDVKSIARLARIEISDTEAAASQVRLNAIFDLIATMQAVDTTSSVRWRTRKMCLSACATTSSPKPTAMSHSKILRLRSKAICIWCRK